MEIKVRTKLIYDNLEFWLVSAKPRISGDRPQHDRYDVVYVREYVEEDHGEILELDVPKGQYMTLTVTERAISITVDELPEPEFPTFVVDPETGEVIE